MQSSGKFLAIGSVVLVIRMVAWLITSGFVLGDHTQTRAMDGDTTGVTLTDHMFEDLFSRDTVIHETGAMSKSASPYWWVSSGGYIALDGGMAHTIQGELPKGSEWQMRFANSNPDATDGGFHPQNIFRMVTRSRWLNFRQECSFRINKLNLSDSASRNQSNGLFLFNRYQDQDNLYYTGLRVDGKAIIKKKYEGVYYTLAEAPVFEGKYDRATQPKLLPLGTWIGIASEVKTLEDGSVEIRLYVDAGPAGEWKPVVTAVDDGVSYGGDVIHDAGYGGIRADFMDVSFESYRIGDDCDCD